MKTPSTPGRPRRYLTPLLLLLLLLLWFTGSIGRTITRWVAPGLLPLRLSEFIDITSLEYGPPPRCPAFGALLVVSPERAKQILRAALPATRWLPPGLLGEGMIVRGRVLGPAIGLPVGHSVNCTIAVTAAQGMRPRLAVRVPRSVVNRILREDLGESLISEDDGLLGDYRIIYKPTFDQLVIRSADDQVPAPVTRRHFTFRANGDMRIKYDGVARVSTHGRVRRFYGTLDFRVLRDEAGLSFWHHLDIHKLRINLNNVQEWLDHAASVKLEEALEKSLNRKKTRKKLAKLRIPHWVPVDSALDFRLSE